MKEVFEQEFCHIHTLQDKSKIKNFHSDKWKVGNILSFRNEREKSNLLFDRVSNPYLNIEWETKLVKHLTRERLNSNSENDYKKIDKQFNEESFLFRYFQFTSELVLEEIRQVIFPKMPSRTNGIWLCERNDLKMWESKIPATIFPQKVFLVKFTGILHKADSKWITEASFNIDNIFKNSIEYWKGNIYLDSDKPAFEYICNGEIKIIGEL